MESGGGSPTTEYRVLPESQEVDKAVGGGIKEIYRKSILVKLRAVAVNRSIINGS